MVILFITNCNYADFTHQFDVIRKPKEVQKNKYFQSACLILCIDLKKKTSNAFSFLFEFSNMLFSNLPTFCFWGTS